MTKRFTGENTWGKRGREPEDARRAARLQCKQWHCGEEKGGGVGKVLDLSAILRNFQQSEFWSQGDMSDEFPSPRNGPALDACCTQPLARNSSWEGWPWCKLVMSEYSSAGCSFLHSPNVFTDEIAHKFKFCIMLNNFLINQLHRINSHFQHKCYSKTDRMAKGISTSPSSSTENIHWKKRGGRQVTNSPPLQKNYGLAFNLISLMSMY